MNMQRFFNRILFGGGVFFDVCKWIIFAVVVVILINKFWFSAFIVDGESMEPNMHDKEVALLQVSSYNFSDPKRGDAVVVRYPGDPDHRKYVKRVIGLPNEKLEIKNDRVYINDKLLEEFYLAFDLPTQPGSIYQLSSNQYFLMGDNRPFSNDSRYFGAVEKRFIVGRATMVIFPRFILVPTFRY